MLKYEEIRDELKKNKYLIYKIKQSDYSFKKILESNKSKKEIINNLENKYNNYSISYKSKIFFVLLKFSFHTGNKILQGGPLSLTISTLVFPKEQNTILKSGFTYDTLYSDISCKIWFPKKYLELNGWKNDYLNNILTKLLNKKVKVSKLGINTYNTLFIY